MSFARNSRASVVSLPAVGPEGLSECQQELVLAGAATHAGKTVFQDPAGLELLYHLAYDLAPVAPAPSEALIVDGAELVEMILDEAVQR